MNQLASSKFISRKLKSANTKWWSLFANQDINRAWYPACDNAMVSKHMLDKAQFSQGDIHKYRPQVRGLTSAFCWYKYRENIKYWRQVTANNRLHKKNKKDTNKKNQLPRSDTSQSETLMNSAEIYPESFATHTRLR